MAQNAGNFTLRFQQELGTDQLVRSGGKHDPLDRELRAVRVDQYGNLMAYPDRPNARVRKVFDFRIDTQDRIDPEKSSGKPDKIHSNCLLPTFVDELRVTSRMTVFMIEIICELVVVFQVFVS